MNCRHCQEPLRHVFLDLGFAPPSNAYLKKSDLIHPESFFPLKLFVCDHCWLVQTEDYSKADELFSADYAYFSSTSQGWLKHAAQYVEMVCSKFELDSCSHVIEIASNDGYLLQNFLIKEIPCLGIEPTDSTAEVAENIGIPVLREFFGADVAKDLVHDGKMSDLVLGNNVYAHVPDINDFTEGLKIILKPEGIITLEFPHLLQLINKNQFDTVYHEHFSYLSLQTVKRIFERAGLRIWDVECLSTHGGSLRIYGCHEECFRETTVAVKNLLDQEKQQGLQLLATYQAFQQQANTVKNDMLHFLIEQQRKGKVVAAYGAAAKGNTLLNYAGVKPDLLTFVCDAARAKQGKYMPGSHIPIYPPQILKEKKPDIVMILPWNIADEVIKQNSYIREWGGVFVVAVPELRTIL